MIPLLIVIGIVVIIAGMLIGTYNKLVTLGARVDKSLADIDVQVKRRFDLIPNLVNVVKGYAKHEAEVFSKVAELRQRYEGAGESDVKVKSEIDSEIKKTVSNFMIQVEAYPELKANSNFIELQEELTNTENKISYARQFYNDIVTKYNTTILQFPTNLLAGMFNFGKRDLFKVEDENERKNVKVEF